MDRRGSLCADRHAGQRASAWPASDRRGGRARRPAGDAGASMVGDGRVVPLDPIVSLSVALAEAPGTCAFFLGSGVSRDAGVPTGWEVMRDGLRKLHRIENPDAEPL